MAAESVSQVLPIPAAKIDVAEWLFSLFDDEYQATARAHLGAGTSRGADGRRRFFDAEAFGVIFIVNHHAEEEARADYVRVRSSDSRAWFLGLVPIRLHVCWEMIVREIDSVSCHVECRLTMEPAIRTLDLVSRLLGARILQRRHLREQMNGFAASMLDKFGLHDRGAPLIEAP